MRRLILHGKALYHTVMTYLDGCASATLCAGKRGTLQGGRTSDIRHAALRGHRGPRDSQAAARALSALRGRADLRRVTHLRHRPRRLVAGRVHRAGAIGLPGIPRQGIRRGSLVALQPAHRLREDRCRRASGLCSSRHALARSRRVRAGVLFFDRIQPVRGDVREPRQGRSGDGLVARGAREAARTRHRLGRFDQHASRQGVHRKSDLPDRSLPRKGGGAKSHGAAVRQRAVRALVAPRPDQARADHGGRGTRGRAAGTFLRSDRGAARHGTEPPAAAVVHHGDGAAGEQRSGRRARRKAQGAARAQAAARPRRPHQDGARSVQSGRGPGYAGARLPRGGRHCPREHHRDVRRPQSRDRLLALGRRAVLLEDRQAPAGSPHGTRGDVRRGAPSHLPEAAELALGQPAGNPPAARREHHDDRARQESRRRHEAQTGEPGPGSGRDLQDPQPRCVRAPAHGHGEGH